MSESVRASLTRELRDAGVTRAAIDAIWPEWWSTDAENSLSATTELRYTIARRLGIAPGSLFDGSPRFIWRDTAKFKNLGTTSVEDQAILTSFGMAVGRALIRSVPGPSIDSYRAGDVRAALLQGHEFVDLRGLLATCWALGIPIVKTNLFPLRSKHMQAMSVALESRFAIIIGRASKYPAWIAFILAHELGHIFSGHVTTESAVLEMDNPLNIEAPDEEERAADRFALELLTGDPNFTVVPEIRHYSATEVASAATEQCRELAVDPGILTLCLAYSTKRWPQSMAALKKIPEQHLPEDVGIRINEIASQQIDWDTLSDESAAYIQAVMGLSRGN